MTNKIFNITVVAGLAISVFQLTRIAGVMYADRYDAQLELISNYHNYVDDEMKNYVIEHTSTFDNRDKIIKCIEEFKEIRKNELIKQSLKGE